MSSRILLRALLATTAIAGGAPALAQTYAPGSAPAVNSSVDGNGVDLISGKIQLVLSSVAIGPTDGSGLEYTVTSDGAKLRDSIEAYIFSADGGKYKITVGTEAFAFQNAGGTFTEIEAQGNSLTYDGSNYYTFTNSAGMAYRFSYALNLAPNGAGPDGFDIGALVDITSPSGAIKTYTYRREVRPILNGRNQVGSAAFRRVQSVVSNAGWMIKPEYDADTINSDLANWTIWSNESSVKAFNNNVVGCAVAADRCAIPAGQQWPQLTPYGYATNGPDGITAFRRVGTPVGTNNLTASYAAGRVSSVVNNGVATSYSYADAANVRTTTRTTSAGSEEYKFEITTGLLKQFKNALGATTAYEYNALKQLVKVTYPENNYVEITPDSRGNVTLAKAVAKPGSPEAPITTSAAYPVACAGSPSCNQPIWTRDARGHQTDYAYDAVHGGVVSVTSPAGANGVRPQVRYGYAALAANGGSIVRLVSTSECRTQASCAGTADETRTTIGYGAVGENGLQPRTVATAAGDGLLTASAAMTYTPAGDLATVDGPLAGPADTTRRLYDPATRRMTGVIGPDPDGGGALGHRAARLTHDADGRVTLSEQGVVASQSDAGWAGFTALQAAATTYDGNGRAARESVTAGGATHAVRHYGYDALGRLDCAAERMDPAAWGSQPDPCAARTSGPDGPDRITKMSYDALGRVVERTVALGTAAASSEAMGYGDNGQLAWARDGEGNRTSYSYDGHDRLRRTSYPVAAGAKDTSSASDYEELGYDKAGNVVSRTLRGNPGVASTTAYDALGRPIRVELAGSSPADPDTDYAYDNFGRLVSAVSSNSHALYLDYDALGRKVREADAVSGRTMQYDLAGRRTRLTWADGFFVSYEHDVAGAVTAIRENGAALLASFAYDDLGRRTRLTRGNGVVTTYGYDAVSRLASLGLDLAGTAREPFARSAPPREMQRSSSE